MDLAASMHARSVVGTDLARALTEDLEPKMLRVSTYLTEAIDVTTRIQKSTDTVLSMSGDMTDESMKKLNKECDGWRQKQKVWGLEMGGF